MNERHRIAAILDRIKLDGCAFDALRFDVVDRSGFYAIRIRSTELPLAYAIGRSFLIAPGTSTADVVRTAFLALSTWVEHEAREAFRFDGVAVFGPHADVEAIAKAEAATEDRWVAAMEADDARWIAAREPVRVSNVWPAPRPEHHESLLFISGAIEWYGATDERLPGTTTTNGYRAVRRWAWANR